MNRWAFGALSAQSIAFSRDDCTLATAAGRSGELWDVKSGELLETLTGHDGVVGVQWLADGKTLVSSSEDGTLR